MPWLDDWKKRIRLTVDGSKIDETLTNFPLLITIASGTGQTNTDLTDVFDELSTTNSGLVDSYTKLLLHTEGDASSSNRTISMYGDPKIYPSGVFNGSMYLAGSDYLWIADSSDWWIHNTESWTIDFWLKKDGAQADWTNVLSRVDATNGWLVVFVAGSDRLGLRAGNGTGGVTTTNDVPDGEWHHYAIVHDDAADKLYMFVDGVKNDEQTASTAIAWTNPGSGYALHIGAQYSLGRYLTGYLDEVRFSKGIARWTDTFSGSLPSVPYTTVSGIDSYTKLMLHFDGDKGSTGHMITFNGDIDSNVSTAKFRTADNGYGSYYFDGSGDYVSIADSSDWTFGSGDFTIDCWFQIPNLSGYKAIFASNTDLWMGMVTNGDRMLYFVSSTGSSWDLLSGDSGSLNGRGSITFTANEWHHVAFVRNGNRWMGFIDGRMDIDVTVVGSIVARSEVRNIGRWGAGPGNYLFVGYMSEFRISKGIARWTKPFTPPTSPYPIYKDIYSSSSKKIAVTTASGSQCYVEIDDWNAYDEKAYLWVKVPTIASGVNSDLYLYYDNTKPDNSTYVGNTAESPAQNVWDSNHAVVWHMAQRPNIGTIDSTSNNVNGTMYGSMTASDLVVGKVDGAFDFDGSNDNVYFGNSSAITSLAYPYTVEFIIKSNNWIQNAVFLNVDGVNDYCTGVYYSSSPGLLVGIPTSFPYGLTPIASYLTDGNTYHWVCVVNSSTSVDFYLNGVRQTLTNTGNYYQATSGTYLAARTSLGNYTNAVIDEVRISNIGRSAGWVKANYYSSWNDLISFGAPEGPVQFLFNGYVKVNGLPASRTVHLHRRDTGEFVGYDVSDPSDGYFEVASNYWGYHYVVILPEIGDGFNLLSYDQIHPGV